MLTHATVCPYWGEKEKKSKTHSAVRDQAFRHTLDLPSAASPLLEIKQGGVTKPRKKVANICAGPAVSDTEEL